MEEDDMLPDDVVLGEGERYLYGVIWSPFMDSTGKRILGSRPNWMIERDCLAAPENAKPRGWKGRAHHFQRFISEIWGTPNEIFWIQWNPNAVEIIRRYCENNITAIAGCASSGKSYAMAVIAVAEFLLRPMDTKILVTSLTKQQSVDRIWGDIQNCWTVAQQFFAPFGGVPGRMLIGKYCIRYEVGKIMSMKSGIQLLAGDASEEKESSTMIQGIKSGNLIVLGDEWSAMPFSIHNTALSNLRANPNARLLAALNPDTFSDPGAAICKPVGGWHKVTVEMTGWPTAVGGWAVHFNGEQSPNILDPRRPWHRILDADGIAAIEKNNPKGTKKYSQFVEGWWSQTGAKQSIYDLADIEGFRADSRELRWIGTTLIVAGLDIGNAHGGDKTILTFGRVGLAKNDAGETHVVCERLETLVLNEDMALDLSMSEQLVTRVKFEMQEGVWGAGTPLEGRKRSCPTANLAVDCTGGGTHFAALLAREIGNGFLMVGFGEKASDLRVSKNDKRRGHEAFANKVSELWGVGVQLIRTGQLKGMDPDLIDELTARTYRDDGAKRMLVESKPEMKRRTNGQSPDCFVCGTRILTPCGETPIERICIGDMVVTPFGSHPVIAVHITETVQLCAVKFSNGTMLVGKPKHAVFTRNRGWVRLDSILLTDKIESSRTLPLWLFLNSLFTRIGNTGFKSQVDTIVVRDSLTACRRNFFIESSGITSVGLFLKACASITKIMTGQIAASTIWRSYGGHRTHLITGAIDSEIQNSKPQLIPSLFARGRLVLNGERPKQEELSSSSTALILGLEESKRQEHALFAGLLSWPSNLRPRRARLHATQKSTCKEGKLRRLVRCAAKAIKVLAIGRQKLVPTSVAVSSLQEPVTVYNLTLAEENVYYANGVLVQNCADSFVLMIESARVRGGLSSSEKAAESVKPPVDRRRLEAQLVELFGEMETVSIGEGGWGEG